MLGEGLIADELVVKTDDNKSCDIGVISVLSHSDGQPHCSQQ
jgi:hypothetical protein